MESLYPMTNAPLMMGFLVTRIFMDRSTRVLCTDGKIRYFNEEEIKLFMSEEEE